MNAKGSALLTALFIMTLVAIVATAMSVRLQLDIYRTKMIVSQDKLYLATQAVTFWAFDELNNTNNKFSRLINQGMVALYPKKLETIDNQIKLNGGIYDLQARLNLNNLIAIKFIPIFIDLLKHTSNIANSEKMNLTNALKDWLSSWEIGRGRDLYTTYYLKQSPPYLPGKQFMQSASELRLIKDLSAPVYLSLKPFIIALPEITPININTTSQKILKSLGSNIQEEQIKEILMARGENGIKNSEKLKELVKKLDLPDNLITIESQYFLSLATASQDEHTLEVCTLFKRIRDKDGNITVRIISESWNCFNS